MVRALRLPGQDTATSVGNAPGTSALLVMTSGPHDTMIRTTGSDVAVEVEKKATLQSMGEKEVAAGMKIGRVRSGFVNFVLTSNTNRSLGISGTSQKNERQEN